MTTLWKPRLQSLLHIFCYYQRNSNNSGVFLKSIRFYSVDWSSASCVKQIFNLGLSDDVNKGIFMQIYSLKQKQDAWNTMLLSILEYYNKKLKAFDSLNPSFGPSFSLHHSVKSDIDCLKLFWKTLAIMRKDNIEFIWCFWGCLLQAGDVPYDFYLTPLSHDYEQTT